MVCGERKERADKRGRVDGCAVSPPLMVEPVHDDDIVGGCAHTRWAAPVAKKARCATTQRCAAQVFTDVHIIAMNHLDVGG